MARLTIPELIARRERVVPAAALAAVVAICWSWIGPMSRDMYGSMTGASAWMMTPRWDAVHVLLLWAMWVVMMVGMMLPSAAPTLLIYAAVARRRGDGGAAWRVYAMAAGYVAVWAGFSAAATVLQRFLGSALVLTPMMETSSAAAAGVLLAGAGAYQLTPIKRACLRWCTPSVSFLARRWREGGSGAFRMGAEHGLYCVGCCWALMLLLFASGVMNLLAIVALTAWVLVEKLVPWRAGAARAAGVLLIAAGVWIVSR